MTKLVIFWGIVTAVLFVLMFLAETKHRRLVKAKRCADCDGSGDHGYMVCRTCEGRGYVDNSGDKGEKG